jgi:hypothetical protein
VTTETTKPDTGAAKATAPTPPAERIRSWLPDHTHVTREVTGATVWTWTTPAGVWGITIAGFRGILAVTGPGGSWSFGVPDDTVLRQTRGMLLALGAIGGES